MGTSNNSDSIRNHTDFDVESVAKLAMLALDGNEISQLKKDMSELVTLVGTLDMLNCEKVNVDEGKNGILTDGSVTQERVNVFREDICESSLERGLILLGTQCKNDEYFVVPRTVEG